jgi:hypothetical protein
MNSSDSPTPDSKYVVTPTGIQFNDELSFEEWLDLGMKISPIAKSIGFKIGDWVNYGSKIYGEKYKGPIEATGIPYQTLANYSRVARKVAPSTRQSSLCYEIHAAVAKLKPHDQKHWLDMADKHKLSVRRLKKSIQLGRLATEEDLLADASDRGQLSHFLPISQFLRWWTSETNKSPVTQWDKEWRETVKTDLFRIVEIYRQL